MIRKIFHSYSTIIYIQVSFRDVSKIFCQYYDIIPVLWYRQSLTLEFFEQIDHEDRTKMNANDNLQDVHSSSFEKNKHSVDYYQAVVAGHRTICRVTAESSFRDDLTLAQFRFYITTQLGNKFDIMEAEDANTLVINNGEKPYDFINPRTNEGYGCYEEEKVFLKDAINDEDADGTEQSPFTFIVRLATNLYFRVVGLDFRARDCFIISVDERSIGKTHLSCVRGCLLENHISVVFAWFRKKDGRIWQETNEFRTNIMLGVCHEEGHGTYDNPFVIRMVMHHYYNLQVLGERRVFDVTVRIVAAGTEGSKIGDVIQIAEEELARQDDERFTTDIDEELSLNPYIFRNFWVVDPSTGGCIDSIYWTGTKLVRVIEDGTVFDSMSHPATVYLMRK